MALRSVSGADLRHEQHYRAHARAPSISDGAVAKIRTEDQKNKPTVFTHRTKATDARQYKDKTVLESEKQANGFYSTHLGIRRPPVRKRCELDCKEITLDGSEKQANGFHSTHQGIKRPPVGKRCDLDCKEITLEGPAGRKTMSHTPRGPPVGKRCKSNFYGKHLT